MLNLWTTFVLNLQSQTLWAVEQVQQTWRLLDQCSLYSPSKASICDLKGLKFQKFSVLRVDNWQFGRQVSLITRLKHKKQTMEFLRKANGATLHYVLASFILFHSVRPIKSLIYCR